MDAKVSTTPGTSTTPAASASSSTSRAASRTRSSSRRCRCSINLLHRGACGCEANTGDGAGILIQMPDAFLRKVARARHHAAAGRRVRRRPRLPAARRRRRATQSQALVRAHRRAKKGSTLLGWRDVPTDDRRVGPSAVAVEPVFEQVFIGRGDRRSERPRRRARARVRAQAVRHPQAHRARGRSRSAMPRARKLFYISACRRNTLIYKGMLTADQIAPMFPDLTDPDVRVGAGARAPALQHQHVPVVAARAPVPLHRAQRRDQHAARQHQLDARARGAARSRRCSATI